MKGRDREVEQGEGGRGYKAEMDRSVYRSKQETEGHARLREVFANKVKAGRKLRHTH